MMGLAGNFALLTEGDWAGWYSWTDRVPGTFMDAVGLSYSRSDAPGRATVMLETVSSHLNFTNALHGGFLATFADHAYFAALSAMGRPEQVGAVTVDLTMQYLGAGTVGPALRAEVDMLKETGRLIFLRLSIFQDDAIVAASSATLRKAPAPR